MSPMSQETRMSAEKKSLKASYDRARKTFAATMKKKKEAERKEKEAIALATRTPEQNIELTRTWWGKP